MANGNFVTWIVTPNSTGLSWIHRDVSCTRGDRCHCFWLGFSMLGLAMVESISVFCKASRMSFHYEWEACLDATAIKVNLQGFFLLQCYLNQNVVVAFHAFVHYHEHLVFRCRWIVLGPSKGKSLVLMVLKIMWSLFGFWSWSSSQKTNTNTFRDCSCWLFLVALNPSCTSRFSKSALWLGIVEFRSWT